MKKLIGGLLVLAILTSPTFSNIDYVSYEIYRLLNQRAALMLEENNEEGESEESRIDDAIADIDANTRYITNLFKEREELLAKIETKMDLHSRVRTTLTESQIGGFVNFMNYNQQSKREINEIMQQIDDRKNLTDVTKEILHIDTDYDLIYNELSSIRNFQYMAIESLNELIDQSNITLELL